MKILTFRTLEEGSKPVNIILDNIAMFTRSGRVLTFYTINKERFSIQFSSEKACIAADRFISNSVECYPSVSVLTFQEEKESHY